MPARRQSGSEPRPSRARPATTPEARENQLISRAMRLAEQQLEDGTASAQVITHYLKLGSSRERIEQERLRHENELLKVKREAYEGQKRIEELYVNAIQAMRAYGGHGTVDDQNE
ncbi:hypothetical protein SEA_BING_1 [Streptomyces phage Bing]|uniref:Uncharacterized protein n=2 Tax=root TaxID=1 RepID=A0A2L1IWD4_9CAUD|nr:hypothetical protein FDJ31_gp01 [Streptomyces phage Bing]AVD99423.1 hypothetical protein SEA_BING_1 [Streptomyces phage Bing]